MPARLAQPGASGPFGSHTSSASGPAIEASTADARTPEWSGQPSAARIQTATSTIRMHPPVSASSHVAYASLPVPNVWTNAIGQHAYASQCVARQAR